MASVSRTRVTDPTQVKAIISIVNEIASLPGSELFLGECSTQAVFVIPGKTTFRIGYTDADADAEDDAADGVFVWCDIYDWRI